LAENKRGKGLTSAGSAYKTSTKFDPFDFTEVFPGKGNDPGAEATENRDVVGRKLSVAKGISQSGGDTGPSGYEGAKTRLARRHHNIEGSVGLLEQNFS